MLAHHILTYCRLNTHTHAGITCTLLEDEHDRLTKFIQFLLAMCEGHGDKVSETLLNISHAPSTLDHEEFEADIYNAIGMFMDPETRKSKTGDGPVLVGDITGEIFRTMQVGQEKSMVYFL